jgi:acyl-CoA thioester hydrolase
MADFETRVRVRYAETDQMGVVYHANYLIWMEVARTDFCSHIGVDYRVMEQEDGCVIAVVDAHVRYAYPARFGDEIIIGVHTIETSVKKLKFEYEMRRASDDRKIATGDTTHLYLSKEDFRPIRLPEKYRAAFRVTG